MKMKCGLVNNMCDYLFFLFFLGSFFSGTVSADNHTSNVSSHNNFDVVVQTRLLKFNKKMSNAYNPSIIEDEDGYLMIFRHDTSKIWCKGCNYKKPEIKIVSLNKNFEQMRPVKTILTDDNTVPEDARIHALGGRLFLTYNDDLLAVKVSRAKRNGDKKRAKGKRHAHPFRRGIFVGKLTMPNGHLSDSKEIPAGDITVAPVEKNWTPFEYPEKSGKLYYIYSTSPYKILEIDHSTEVPSVKNISCCSDGVDQVWQKDVWGPIRGGTPARLVDGVYVTFFHSMKYFPDFKSLFYVMGAYTFEAKPPFKILAITPNPIFFQDVYSAPHRLHRLHSIYPAGFALEKKSDKTLLHVSCGENDTSIRIVSIDKDALLRSMVPLV